MPIVYETPAPVAGFAVLGQQQERALQRQRADAAQQAAYAGAGRGGGFSDEGMQAAVNHRDDLQFRQAQQAESGNFTARDAGLARAAQDQQVSRFHLEAELSQTQLTQAENMRLVRMKNAIGEVSSDPTLTDAEKAAIITQLRTGINPLEQRATLARIKSQEAENTAQADRYRAQAMLDQEQLKVATSGAIGRRQFFPDETALAEIAADFKANLPPWAQVPDEAIAEMARQEAIKQGLGKYGTIQPGNKIEYDKEAGAGASGKGKGDQPAHQSGLSPQDFLKALDHANAAVQREATMTRDENGQKVPVHPELSDPDKRDERVRRYMKALGLPADFGEYSQGVKEPEKKGYKSPHKKPEPPAQPGEWMRRRAGGPDEPVAAAATQPAQSPARQPAPEATEAARKMVLADVDKAAATVREWEGVTEDEKAAVQTMLAEGKRLADKYPVVADRPEWVQKKLAELKANYLAVKKKVTPPRNVTEEFMKLPPVAAAVAQPAPITIDQFVK